MHLRDVLEEQYGQYPRLDLEDREDVVRDRRLVYGAVQRLYGMRPIRSLEEIATLEVRPLWARLLALHAEPEDGILDRLAEEAMVHAERAERLVTP